jgi:hypothetical protein
MSATSSACGHTAMLGGGVQEALDAGWTVSELATAGLKPPAPPRKRSSTAEAAAAPIYSRPLPG